MNYSISEIRALVQKAAMGARMPLGLAQELAWSAIWLERRGAAGLEAVVTFLNHEANGNPNRANCPIRMGVSLLELPDLDTNQLEYGQWVAPLLIQPYLARYAQDHDHELQLAIPANMDFRAAPVISNRIETTTDIYQSLNEFAHKTYAPATEESRRLGAGAQSNDND